MCTVQVNNLIDLITNGETHEKRNYLLQRSNRLSIDF